MPVIHSAKKKMRKDKRRTKANKEKKETLKKILKIVKLKPTRENIRKAQGIIDKTAKVNLIHKNKAARLKSQIAKLISKSIDKSKTEVQAKTQKLKVKSKNKKHTLSSLRKQGSI